MAAMFDNVTISPPLANGSLNLCYLEGDARSHSSSLYAATLSASVIIAIFSPVAVVGNALIMAVIWKNQSLRTPSYILLCCLALTDLCTGLITQPFQVTADLICLQNPQALEKQSTVRISRIIVEGSASFFTCSTIILVTLMSVERWLHMTRQSLLTVHRTFIMIVTIESLFVVPLAVFRVLHFLNGNFETFHYAARFTTLLACLLITSFAYFKVYRVIHRHQEQVKESELQNFGRQAINLAKYKRSVLTVLYILVLFYISYVPVLVLMGLSLFSYHHSDFQLLYRVFIMFWLLSSSLNPLIYFWRMNDIRNGVKNLLKILLENGN